MKLPTVLIELYEEMLDPDEDDISIQIDHEFRCEFTHFQFISCFYELDDSFDILIFNVI